MALSELDSLSRGQISIKTTSVLSAVEFYLSKDVMQRALSARPRFGSPEVVEWMKIKRGSDRIFLLLPEGEPDKVICFAAGRDVVYRGI